MWSWELHRATMKGWTRNKVYPQWESKDGCFSVSSRWGMKKGNVSLRIIGNWFSFGFLNQIHTSVSLGIPGIRDWSQARNSLEHQSTVNITCLHAQSHSCVCVTLALWDPMDRSPPGSSAHGLSQARMLEWVAHFLLQGLFLTQGSNPHLLHWQMDSLPLHPLRRP